jgi:phosphopantothenoylcysteine decarboxylase/phosphopantothenate--cysteine ligase
MNSQMWLNPAVQNNIYILKNRSIEIIEPQSGQLACEENGVGRLADNETILDQVKNTFFIKHVAVGHPLLFKNKSIVITAGPTVEAIDPVRFISNRSSGKMGYALADAARDMGANVTLISGPVQLAEPAAINTINVSTAAEMEQVVMDHIQDCDVFIGCAAVADYRVDKPANQKIKKNHQKLTLNLVKNPDILKNVANLKKRPFTVGFAAETENLQQNAMAKKSAKKLDMIIANQVGSAESGFDSDQNQVLVLGANEPLEIELKDKSLLAYDLLKLIDQEIRQNH